MRKSEEGEIFELVLHGPKDNSPETRSRLREALSKKLHFPLHDLEELLLTAPLSVMKATSEKDLEVACETLKQAGGKVFIVKPKENPEISEAKAEAQNLIEFKLDVDLFKDEHKEDPSPKSIEGKKDDGFEIDFSLDPMPLEAEEIAEGTKSEEKEAPVFQAIEPKELKVQSNRTIYFELESKSEGANTSGDGGNTKPKKSGHWDLILPLAVGLAVLIAANILLLGRSPEKAESTISLGGDVFNPLPAKKKAPVESAPRESELKTAAGMSKDGESLVEVKIELNETGIKGGSINALGAKPPPRSALDVAKNIPAEPWLYKVEVDVGAGSFNQSGSVMKEVLARVYTDREGKRERLTVPGTLSVQKLVDGKYRIVFDASYNYEDGARSGLIVLGRNSGQETAVMLHGEIIAEARP